MDHVTLDIAKRLKEAGWPQNSTGCYYHWFPKDTFTLAVSNVDAIAKTMIPEPKFDAPSIGELLEALPEGTGLMKGKAEEGFWTFQTNYWKFDSYVDDHPGGRIAENPADALALLWIALRPKGK